MAGVPMHRGRTNATGRGRPQRRKLVWATDVANGVTVASGAKLPMRDLLANLEVAGSSILGATVIRTHMRIAVNWGTADVATGVTYGLIVNDAPTVTNLDPSSPAQYGYDWMLWDTMVPGTADQLAISGTVVLAGRHIDLRAKRKIEELAEKYWFVLINTGTASIPVTVSTRTLIALP